jgi:hypothetical protein
MAPSSLSTHVAVPTVRDDGRPVLLRVPKGGAQS